MTSVRTRLRMGLIGTGVIGTAMLAAAAPVGAQPRTFTATLNGAQEVPPSGSPATGTGSLVFDAAAATLRVSLTFSGLTSPTGGPVPPAHLHAAPPGVNGPVIVPFAFVPVGITSGSFLDQLINLTPDQVASLNTNLVAGAGGMTNMYFNVHTQQFPGGEIRGQVMASVVPEPGTWALLGAGLIGIAGVARGRRREG